MQSHSMASRTQTENASSTIEKGTHGNFGKLGPSSDNSSPEVKRLQILGNKTEPVVFWREK